MPLEADGVSEDFKDMRQRQSLRVGLACCLAAAALAAGSAKAEEGVAFKNLMGNIGILPGEKDPIHYRERAPLVVPPKADLRPPSAGLAASNPQWPNDPDVAARRRRTTDERRPVTWSETRRMSGDNNRLTPDELARGRVARDAAPEARSARHGDTRDSLVLTPDQMRAGHRAQEEVTASADAPARKTLSDPPSAYRRSASGGAVTAQSAPRVDQQTLDANPMNWIRQQFSRGDDD